MDEDDWWRHVSLDAPTDAAAFWKFTKDAIALNDDIMPRRSAVVVDMQKTEIGWHDATPQDHRSQRIEVALDYAWNKEDPRQPVLWSFKLGNFNTDTRQAFGSQACKLSNPIFIVQAKPSSLEVGLVTFQSLRTTPETSLSSQPILEKMPEDVEKLVLGSIHYWARNAAVGERVLRLKQRKEELLIELQEFITTRTSLGFTHYTGKPEMTFQRGRSYYERLATIAKDLAGYGFLGVNLSVYLDKTGRVPALEPEEPADPTLYLNTGN